MAGLDKQREVYRASVAALADPQRTQVILVSRAEQAALKEARRLPPSWRPSASKTRPLFSTAYSWATDPLDPLACSMEARGQCALKANRDFLLGLPVYSTSLHANNMLGLDSLRGLLDKTIHAPNLPMQDFFAPDWPDLDSLVNDLQTQGHGVVMTMGKGGVGKTTLAAAIALALAHRGEKVHLSTTDPAAHILDASGGEMPGLTISRIDPALETAAYVAEVLATQASTLTNSSRELLEEDLRSPCTEESPFFRAFARTVAGGKDRFVILDTAPTGHTLLLLDATEAYHREIGTAKPARHAR